MDYLGLFCIKKKSKILRVSWNGGIS